MTIRHERTDAVCLFARQDEAARRRQRGEHHELAS
jgi:hypothetical protein